MFKIGTIFKTIKRSVGKDAKMVSFRNRRPLQYTPGNPLGIRHLRDSGRFQVY